MRDAIRIYLRKNDLLAPNEPLWVAVSGGLDSMVLLHVLRALGHPCSVAHVDHGLRGDASTGDQEFVQAYCAALDIPFQMQRVDVGARSTDTGVSKQMAARELRYAWFNQLTADGPHTLALAHHADDAVETLFIGLMQGMGLHGWETIPARSGPFIRPLLGASRNTIRDYAEEHGVPWREDASNADTAYLRNRIRHELLPLLESWRPGTHRNLERNVRLFRELDQLAQHSVSVALDGLVPDARGSLRVPFERVISGGMPLLVLHRLLRTQGFHPDQLESIHLAMLEGRTGALFFHGEHHVLIDRGELVIGKRSGPFPSWVIPAVDSIPIDAPLCLAPASGSEIDPAAGPRTAWLDLDLVEFPLVLRPWSEGDRMRPNGACGSKLVSDILIDAKVPRDRKQRSYVLVQGERVLWLCGHRLAEGCRASPTSKRVVRCEWTAD